MQNKEPKNGLLTEPMDTNSLEFIKFKEMILEKSKLQTNEQKANIKLALIKFGIDYK